MAAFKTLRAIFVGSCLRSCLWFTIISARLAYGEGSYPTLWQIENESPSSVLLTCQGKAPGLAGPIIFPLREIAAGGRQSHSWVGWHNDGLGLNAANWQCTVKTKDAGVESFAQFQTQFGQDSLLVIRNSGAQIELIRLDLSKNASAQTPHAPKPEGSGKKQ